MFRLPKNLFSFAGNSKKLLSDYFRIRIIFEIAELIIYSAVLIGFAFFLSASSIWLMLLIFFVLCLLDALLIFQIRMNLKRFREALLREKQEKESNRKNNEENKTDKENNYVGNQQ